MRRSKFITRHVILTSTSSRSRASAADSACAFTALIAAALACATASAVSRRVTRTRAPSGSSCVASRPPCRGHHSQSPKTYRDREGAVLYALNVACSRNAMTGLLLYRRQCDSLSPHRSGTASSPHDSAAGVERDDARTSSRTRSSSSFALRRSERSTSCASSDNILWLLHHYFDYFGYLHRPRLGFRDTAVGHVNEPHGRRTSYNNKQ